MLQLSVAMYFKIITKACMHSLKTLKYLNLPRNNGQEIVIRKINISLNMVI